MSLEVAFDKVYNHIQKIWDYLDKNIKTIQNEFDNYNQSFKSIFYSIQELKERTKIVEDVTNTNRNDFEKRIKELEERQKHYDALIENLNKEAQINNPESSNSALNKDDIIFTIDPNTKKNPLSPDLLSKIKSMRDESLNTTEQDDNLPKP